MRGAAQQRGIDFEHHVAKILDGKLQPGSGNRFYAQGDVRAHGVLLSCKSQEKFTWGEIVSYLKEARKMSYGTGDIPAMAIDDASRGMQLAIVELTDFGAAMGGNVSLPAFVGSKGEERRKLASIPVLLRE